jgi:hypothetical protein
MMTGTGLGWGNLPTDKDLPPYARKLIAKHDDEAASREAEEQTKENALREARRMRNGGARKDLEGKVVAEDDGGNVTRNRGNVCNLANKYPTHIKGMDATARRVIGTVDDDAYKANRDEHRIKRLALEVRKNAERKARLAAGRKAKSAVDEAIDLLDGKGAAE